MAFIISTTQQRSSKNLPESCIPGIKTPWQTLFFSCVSLPKQMHYFTRADVFANPLARAILLRINMMPIFRPVDHAPQMVERNQDTFNAAHARLSAGAHTGYFPRSWPSG